MVLNRIVKIQLAIFTVISVVLGAVMILRYINLPAMLFGVGRYTVAVELPRAGGLYPRGNVTYRGTEVGRVEGVHLTGTGVEAVLSLNSGIDIPSDLQAEVHSTSAVGEQYVALLPRNGNAPPLKDGDVIPVSHTSVPPALDELLDATDRGLAAIPHDNLKTVIDESYTAVGGLGPELSRLVKSSTQLAIDTHTNLDALTTLIDQSKPVLDSQAETSDAIQAWAAHLATITGQLHTHDSAVAGVLHNGGPTASEGRQLFERLQPTLPLLLANLVSITDVALVYQPAVEQLLVLLPPTVAHNQVSALANRDTKQAYRGYSLNSSVGNFGLPPECTTGFLPPQQRRSVDFEDYPDLPPGDLYCRVPQDSLNDVRGVRNFPCLTRPGKRAPTVKMCESDEQYVPLNEGYNWKGDPNATWTGQDVPQLPPGSPPAQNPHLPGPVPPPIAAAEYDPATGTYIGPDGHLYRQSDLAQSAPKEQTWQSMLIPPTQN